jgi:hypothetical protein
MPGLDEVPPTLLGPPKIRDCRAALAHSRYWQFSDLTGLPDHVRSWGKADLSAQQPDF